MKTPHAGQRPALRVLASPAPGVTGRSLLATVEIMLAITGAHLWAGGHLPSLPWLAVMTGGVFVATRALLRGRIRMLPAALGLGAAQLASHHFMALMDPHVDHGHGAASLSWQMALAHAIGALATLLVWALRQRAVELLYLWSELLAAVVAAPRRAFGRTDPVVVALVLRGITGTPRRGPPVALLGV